MGDAKEARERTSGHTDCLVWTSEYNAAANKGFCFPDKVGVYDTTLRDGEQTPGLVFDKQDKLKIARALDEVGVDRIEVGMPAVSPEDREAIALILGEGLKAELWGFCRARTDDIDACLELGLDHLLVEYPTSPLKIRAYGFDDGKVESTISTAVKYAKDRGAYVGFMAVDGTRTPIERLKCAMSAAVLAGCDELVLADTVSAATPEAIGYLVTSLRQGFELPIGIHCHNEFGLATACALAAVRAGATWVHVTVNGLGEKSGNTDIAEIVLSLKLLYGVESSLDIRKLTWLAKTVECISDVRLSPSKPVVGDYVFTRESGSVVNQMIKLPAAVECYDPSLLGRERKVVLGKKSGREAVRYVLREMGLAVSDEELPCLVEAVKKTSILRKGPVGYTELPALLAECRKSL